MATGRRQIVAWVGVFSLWATAVFAQGAIERRAQPVAYPQAQSLYLLLTPQMQKELEIVPEQQEQLEKLKTKSHAQMTESYKKLQDIPVEERQAKYLEVMRAVGEETEKEVRDILLPMQIKRLRQIALQTKLQQMQWGGAQALLADELAEELEITAEQKTKFAETEKELREEIQRKTQEFYKQLQEDSRTRLLEVLTPEQRRKLEGLSGPKYEWKQK